MKQFPETQEINNVTNKADSESRCIFKFVPHYQNKADFSLMREHFSYQIRRSLSHEMSFPSKEGKSLFTELGERGPCPELRNVMQN